MYHEGEERADVGYYADYEPLRTYCCGHGLPFVESGGLVSVD
jgi:hypothetical protein